jgi:hypothetical protein
MGCGVGLSPSGFRRRHMMLPSWAVVESSPADREGAGACGSGPASGGGSSRHRLKPAPYGAVESTMIRHVLAVALAGALIAPAAHAQGPDSDDNRYQFNRVEDGYLRLDLKSGQVSLCSRRTVGWSCLAIPDDRAALDSEIARLQAENASLKKTLLDQGMQLPGGIKSEPPVARGGDTDLKLPSNADIDRVMTAVEKVWRRLVEMIVNLQKDILKKT